MGLENILCKRERDIKEKICKLVNDRQNYFRNLSFRVGSKSIKKKDILDVKIEW